MAVREIVVEPHPVLRKQAEPVEDFGPELQRLIDDMIETMRAAPGVGLAAPQVNVSKQVIVVEYGEDEDNPQLYVVINPRLRYIDPDMVLGTEGCLSIPNVFGEVWRSRKVIVEGLDRQGNPITVEAEDWLARIFQHEIDHLHGILFVDKAVRIWRETAPETTETPKA